MNGSVTHGGSSGGNNVVGVQRFQARASLTPIRQAEAYWTALRNDGDVPMRSQVDPRGLQNLLEYAFVIERVAPGIARIRLAGQHITMIFGMELRGMPVSALFSPAAREDIKNALVDVFDAPAVCELNLSSEARYGRPAFNAHMILLPLKSDLGDVSRALGVMVCDACPSQNAPARFNISATAARHIQNANNLPSHIAEKGAVSGFSERAAEFRSKPNLTLVKSDN